MTRPQLLLNDLSRHTQPLRKQIDQAVHRVLDRGWFVFGPELEAFEAEFAAYTGTRFCRGVANGTDALELALRAIGVGSGSRVATVAIAGMYATTAILACGAEPVYIDIRPGNWWMNLDHLRAESSRGLTAIVATHLYGRMESMPELLEAAGSTPVIEDCAQSHGAQRNGRKCGGWGIAGCFSFYPTKNLGALGDGGAITTSDRTIADRVAALRQYGWTSRYRSAVSGGRNSRLDEIQAAVLRTKLPHLDTWNERRRAIASRYQLAPRARTESDVVHLYVIRSRDREQIRESLRDHRIASDIHYPVPDYRQESVRPLLGNECELPETERHCAEVLTLPCFPEMMDEEVEAVEAIVRPWLGARR